jgi:lysylphosphatidylglycerol synthetase-like protein (DUF2156 family)
MAVKWGDSSKHFHEIGRILRKNRHDSEVAGYNQSTVLMHPQRNAFVTFRVSIISII